MTSHPTPQELAPRLGAIEQAVASLIERTPEDVMRLRPPAGGWSMAEVLEHLVISTDSYNAELRTALARPGLPPGDPAAWRNGLAGGFILRSLVSPRRMPAPPAWKVRAAPRERAGHEFLRALAESRQLIERAAGLDWNAITIRSPALRLLRMRIGEAFVILVVHAERHLRQLERVRKEVVAEGSPSATTEG